MTDQPDSIMSVRELCAQLLPHTTSVHNVELIKARDEAVRNAALEDVVNYIEANGHSSGWKQIKFHINFNMKTPIKEPQ